MTTPWYEVLQGQYTTSWYVLREGEIVYVCDDELTARHWMELNRENDHA